MDKHSPILIADDSTSIRMLVKGALTSLGYEQIHVASDGTEAMNKIRSSMAMPELHYKVIFLDWSMPGEDGFTILQSCINDYKLENTAIVMLTAVSDQKSILKTLKAGAVSYIVKPVSMEVIKSKLEQVDAWFQKKKEKV